MTEQCFIIGIDFGTTYSGVSWCWSGQPDVIGQITNWKSQKYMNADSAKAPTQLYYSTRPERLHWGFDIPSDVTPFEWFKLLLMPHEKLPQDFRSSSQLRDAHSLMKQEGKDAVTLVADYLRLLWSHTIETITREKGLRYVGAFPFKVWITIPAIWDETASRRMRQAAEKAGILQKRAAGPTELAFVAEPEAAAFAVLHDLKGRPDVKPGDVFVVCDAGGGTVDIISYEVLGTQPLRFKECIEGQGKMCGAIFIDEAFSSAVTTRLGTKWTRMSVASQKALINNEWQHGIKRQFDDEDKEWTVTVAPEAFESRMPKWKPTEDNKKEVPLEHGQLKFRRGHIRSWFQVVLPHIRGLIHAQVDKVKAKKGYLPYAIMLVGGLGCCNYLYTELRQEFEPKEISVLQSSGTRPWTAICRGAVIRGLSDTEVRSGKQSTLVSRVSRYSYGISFCQEFKQGFHDPRDMIWDTQRIRWNADGQMEWYLKRGTDVGETDPANMQFEELFQSPSEQLSGTVRIFKSDQENPSSRINETVTFETDIRVDVSAKFADLPVWRNKQGQEFRSLKYRVEMNVSGAVMNWKAYVNEQVSGQSSFGIDFM